MSFSLGLRRFVDRKGSFVGCGEPGGNIMPLVLCFCFLLVGTTSLLGNVLKIFLLTRFR